MILDILLDKLRTLGIVLVWCAAAVALAYVLALWRTRRKQNREMEERQAEVLRKGRSNAKRLKLRRLYSSKDGAHPMLEGSILAYAEAEDGKRHYALFAARKARFDAPRFYKVDKGRHGPLFRDVTLMDWNFSLDDEGCFLLPNETKTVRSIPYDKDMKSVDTLGNIAPLVHKAILGNYIHRIRMREHRLIKLPEQEQKL
jgi:hypothetical protein